MYIGTGRKLNSLCTFNLRLVSTGLSRVIAKMTMHIKKVVSKFSNPKFKEITENTKKFTEEGFLYNTYKFLYIIYKNRQSCSLLLQFSLQADTVGAKKKLFANWRCPPFGKFFNIALYFENKASFNIKKAKLGWLVVSRVISDYEKREIM